MNVYYDVETTGLNFRKHSIVQLSGIIEEFGEVIESFDYLIRPHPKAVVDEGALYVNGRTESEIQGFPPMETMHKEFKTLLGQYIDPYNPKDKAHLIGFNNRYFDDPFLRQFFELCGDRFIGSWFWADTLDVLVLASQHLKDRRFQMPSFKLHRVAQALDIEVDQDRLHDALYDVELTRAIYLKLTE